MEPRISVLIRALNEEKHLPTLISALKNQTLTVSELILVDSGSTDRTVSIAHEAGFTIETISPQEFSFGRALNLGFSACTGEIVVVLSAHVSPTGENFLEELVRPFEIPQIAVAYGRQVGDHRTKFSESQVMRGWFPETSIWDQEHPFSNNANAAIRRATWVERPYDESLTGLEDLDFAKEAQNRGWKIAYVSEAAVIHVHEETWRKVYSRYTREAAAYRRIFPGHWLTGPSLLALLFRNISHDVAQAQRERVLLQNLFSILLFRCAQFAGTWRGSRIQASRAPELIQRFYYPPARSDSSTPEKARA